MADTHLVFHDTAEAWDTKGMLGLQDDSSRTTREEAGFRSQGKNGSAPP
jgi:hypothetical protein